MQNFLLEPATMDNTHALILCGGQGQRVGGADKGLLRWHGRRAVDRAISFVRQQRIQHISISANRHTDVYAELGLPVLMDQRALYQGPLAGIEAGLMAGVESSLPRPSCEWLLVLPCDSLSLPLNLLPRMMAAVGKTSLPLVWAAHIRGLSEHEERRHHHHSICLVHHTQLDHVTACLNGGYRSLRHWQYAAGGRPVYFDYHFGNFNTLDCWQQEAAPAHEDFSAFDHELLESL